MTNFQFEGCASEPPKAPAGVAVEFKVSVPEEILEDLSARLNRARFPNQLEGAEDWSYGTELTYLKSLVEYWKNSYDWRKQEAALNEFSHFKMYIPQTDINVHFIHAKSPRADAKPLLLAHGWPGSFYEFHKIAQRLSNPEDPKAPAFHLILKTGYGFSSAPKTKGFNTRKIGDTFNQLMVYLGYTRYFAQGGDWGAIIVRSLGLNHAKNCAAIHINMCVAMPSLYNPIHVLQLVELATVGPTFFLTKQEAGFIADTQFFQKNETAYQAIQGTKPQTLGYGLNDSPVGLLAWIVEKFRTWSDCKGNVENKFSKDEIITNIMIYWVNGAITSSTRLYYESIGQAAANKYSDSFQAYVTVPTGVAVFPKELFKAPKSWAQASYNVKHWSVFNSGGHFAALEEPDTLLQDMRAFFGPLSKSLSKTSKL
ncbi:microsomal epoxide hydrolase [Synchytrium microbalum]|uniref:Microsomal epoxide hydrolase n=1 Tax=Synchytrium microbalum TaxID=1806994 RepID=A0A507C1B7_9FUNG|nr:microsomal epoxide hydrolase [Synchytrium microbalum]TPX32849.1 microsomal epoxide hydrolase [Synchytrium microbalum]